jgi:hypothetical protein
MKEAERLEKIKARLESPSVWVGGWDPRTTRDMRWLIALVERQASEIEQLKSSSSLHVSNLLRRA